MAKNPKRTERILEAASRVFYRDGFAAASMDQIAREAGVSKATLYSHFANKDALFQTAVQCAAERFVLEMDLAGLQKLPVEQALVAMGRYYLRFLLKPENLAVVRAVIAEAIRQPDLGRQFYESGPTVGLAGVEQFLKARQASGDLPAGDAHAGARHFVALVRGDIHWRALLGIQVETAQLEQCARSAAQQFLHGFAKPV